MEVKTLFEIVDLILAIKIKGAKEEFMNNCEPKNSKSRRAFLKMCFFPGRKKVYIRKKI